MKKALFAALLALMCAAVFAAAQPEVASKSPEEYKIAVVTKSADDPWFIRMSEGINEYAKENGLNVYQKWPASADPDLQAQLIMELIADEIDALCVVPVEPDALEPVLKKARDRGIAVIAHEGAGLKNADYDIEAFSNAAFGAFLMNSLAEEMGKEGIYTTMVASFANGSQNEWADAAVAYQKERFPEMQLLEVQPRAESEGKSDTACTAARKLFTDYPNLRGILATACTDVPGIVRAVRELGLTGRVFVYGTGIPSESRELLQNGIIGSVAFWDPALAGKAMVALAVKVLNGEYIWGKVDLGIDGYKNMTFRPGSMTVLEGEGWFVADRDNVDSFMF